MKRILSIGITALFCIALLGCSGDTVEQEILDDKREKEEIASLDTKYESNGLTVSYSKSWDLVENSDGSVYVYPYDGLMYIVPGSDIGAISITAASSPEIIDEYFDGVFEGMSSGSDSSYTFESDSIRSTTKDGLVYEIRAANAIIKKIDYSGFVFIGVYGSTSYCVMIMIPSYSYDSDVESLCEDVIESVSIKPIDSVEKVELKKLMDQCSSISMVLYTDESYAIFSETLLSASTVYENAESTKEDYVAARDSLQAAKDGLTEKPKPTLSQSNALESAKSYLRAMAFSYTGLIEQLEYEKYSYEDAVYAVDNCGADWNEQAAKSAKSYLNAMPFSRDGLIDQLIYEGFTYDQAVYGVDSAGL